MRTIPFKQVFNKVARWNGYNPTKDIDPDVVQTLVDHINDRVRQLVPMWQWPEWNVTEERAYRQVWNVDHNYLRVSSQNKPDEVFYKQNSVYYQVRSDAVNDPPAGTLPTDTNFWVEMASDQIGTYIAYDQPCRRAIGTAVGVYSQNPSLCGCNGHGHNGLLKYRPSQNGIEICHPGAPTVFITYQMPVPKYTMVPYATGKTYFRADIIFDPVTGECYQAGTTTIDGPNTTAWSRVPFLEVWEKYVVYGAFADSLSESDRSGNQDMAARQAMIQHAEEKAEDALQREIDNFTMQGQKLEWRTCKRHGEWCESMPWSGGDVSTISDLCEDGFFFPYPPPQIPPSAFGCPTPDRCPDVAYIPEPNVFENVNTIPGARFGTKVITADYTLSVVDFAVLVDASAGPINIYLPMALGSGQFYHVSKADSSGNPVIVNASSGEQIDGQPVFVLGVQYADMAMIDADLGRWDRFGVGVGPPIDLSDFARLSISNTFTALNTLTGVQFATKTVTADYTLTPLDFTVLVDATAGPVTVTLPLAIGSGQVFHIKQIDSSGNYLTIQSQGSDLIDGAISLNFTGTQWSNVLLQDADSGYWDNIGAPNVLYLSDPPPATPTTLNQVIALLQSYGLCA